jgi:hypothetical protein
MLKERASGKKAAHAPKLHGAATEPDTMLEYTIHMDNHHAAISKQVVILWT